MMKKILKPTLLLVALLLGTAPAAYAQVGKLFKKVKKAATVVTGTQGNAASPLAGAVKAVPVTAGGTMENPLAAAVEIDLEAAHGVSTSANYGQIYLLLKVKMIANKAKINLGGTMNNVKTMAIDQDGNAYFTDAFAQVPKDVTEGVAVKVKLDGKNERFLDVKKTAVTLQQIKLNCYIDAANRGVIVFKNVPVTWDAPAQ